MKQRSYARELALQLLYQTEIQGASDSNIESFWEQIEEDKGSAVGHDTRVFAMALYKGVRSNADDLDKEIAKVSEHWDVNRMAVIDRNLLRIGVFELLHEQDTPGKVVMNEAIELAKRFGDPESSKFINGILDKIHKTNLL